MPDVEGLRAHWRETQVGQLMADPAMEPFVQDLKRQFQQKATRLHDVLGLNLADLEGVAGGEATIALVEPAKDKVALVVLVDVTGHIDKARGLLAKMGGRLAERKATKEVRQIDGAELTVYTGSEGADDRPPRQAAFAIHADMLLGSDNSAVAAAILRRLSHPTDAARDNLAQLAAYRQIMARCREAAGTQIPDFRWFIDPFGCVRVVRAANPQRKKKRGKDLAKILAAQGFSCIEGVGGYVHLYLNGKYELLHRTAVYAPPLPGREKSDEKYALAARMMRFPNGGTLAPARWVPRQVALYASLNWEIQRAFDASETLVDALIGQKGAFQDILDGIREDQVGPQIDLRSELVGHLGRRATIITDYQLPITPQSERWLFAVEATDQAAVQQAIKRTMESDPNAKKHDYDGHVVWEITDEETELPELTVESPAFDPLLADSDAEKGTQEKGSLPSSAVCVAYDQLLIASHFDFLVKILVEASEQETLARCADYELVMEEMAQVSPSHISLRLFSRTDEDYRPTYDLIRAGRMPEAESLLGRLLNVMLGEGDEDVLRPQRIDGSKLPNFEMVRRYLGPAGLTVTSEKNGWYVTGFMLNKEAPPANPRVAKVAGAAGDEGR